MAELDGPRLAPKSGTARQLVVFLHGYGADGNDLIDIGRAWQPALPDAAFVSPHAPNPCAQAPVGREWFGLTFRDPDERWRGVNNAGPGLEKFIAAELATHNLTPDALALVGFSQGTMMALHVGLRRAVAPAAIVGYSGMLVTPKDGPAEAIAAEITARPPVLLIHGDQDQVIPVQALLMSAQGLASIDVPVEWAHLARHRPRHRQRGPAPRRRIPGQAVSGEENYLTAVTSARGWRPAAGRESRCLCPRSAAAFRGFPGPHGPGAELPHWCDPAGRSKFRYRVSTCEPGNRSVPAHSGSFGAGAVCAWDTVENSSAATKTGAIFSPVQITAASLHFQCRENAWRMRQFRCCPTRRRLHNAVIASYKIGPKPPRRSNRRSGAE